MIGSNATNGDAIAAPTVPSSGPNPTIPRSCAPMVLIKPTIPSNEFKNVTPAINPTKGNNLRLILITSIMPLPKILSPGSIVSITLILKFKNIFSYSCWIARKDPDADFAAPAVSFFNC